jgi:Mu-like prophage I protein
MAKPKLLVSTKRFTLSDDSLNRYGFRMLSAGADLTDFEANPIMLFMHEGSGRKYAENATLPIGIWQDIKIENNAITAVPAFDAGDEFAVTIYNKVEAGILRMASIGANPIEESQLPEHLLPGQTRSTITKWEALEASICDFGANRNALAMKFPNVGRIELSDGNIDTYLPKLNIQTMIKLSAKAIIALGLAEVHTEADINEAIVKLNAKVETAEADKEAALVRATVAEKASNDAAINLTAAKVEALVGGAVASGKITEKQKPAYEALAKSNFDATELALASIAGRKPIAGSIDNKQTDKDTKFLEMSWSEIDKSNQLGKLKNEFPEEYALKYAEHFGK